MYQEVGKDAYKSALVNPSKEDILSMHCDSRTILINAANYCYHLIVKIYRLTRYLF